MPSCVMSIDQEGVVGVVPATSMKVAKAARSNSVHTCSRILSLDKLPRCFSGFGFPTSHVWIGQ